MIPAMFDAAWRDPESSVKATDVSKLVGDLRQLERNRVKLFLLFCNRYRYLTNYMNYIMVMLYFQVIKLYICLLHVAV